LHGRHKKNSAFPSGDEKTIHLKVAAGWATKKSLASEAGLYKSEEKLRA
jgi:hypothetical protein